MRTTWSFHTAGAIHFGRGATDRLGEIARELGAGHALVVTDKALVKAGLADQVQSRLASGGVRVTLFDGGEPEPSIAALLRCHDFASRQKPDLLVGLGGGSNMDLAKTVGVLLTHGGEPRDYMGEGRVPGPILPLIAVPTTAGTGSEVTHAGILTDTENNIKVAIASNYLRPRAAVVDPLMTVTCPPKATADSGIDALTHAVEAFMATDSSQLEIPKGEVSIYQGRNPLGNALVEPAVGLIARHLADAVRDGQNLDAREGMHLAALIAGMGFSNVGVGAVHALEYPIGGAVHCSHGCGNGLLLPYVMEFNKPARVEALARLAELMGLQVEGLSPEAAADAAIERVRSLRKEIGIPDKLREIGVQEHQLRSFAEAAFGIKRLMRSNPRRATVDDLESILQAAF
jgi:alcohol dehydrogenase class IV